MWVVFLVLLSQLSLAPLAESEWKVARPDYAWSFPEDHWAREGYKTEWWYFTGHLEAETGERFGYQFTIFRVGLLMEQVHLESSWNVRDLIMGHLALSPLPSSSGGREAGESRRPSPDPTDDGHRFSEVLYRASSLLGGFGTYPDSLIAWCRPPAGTEGRWTLNWNGYAFDFAANDGTKGIAIDLTTCPAKPRIFQGPNGFSRKGVGKMAASQYYSFTRLETSGSVTLDGKIFEVTGQSWMDKEFGSNQLGEDQVGWDWFSLQLADGCDLMLYVLRNGDGGVDYASGTIVGAEGGETFIGHDDFTIEVLDRWTSPDGETTYPARWSLSVPSRNMQLEIVPEKADQENRSTLIPSMRYWEGAVQVLDKTGTPGGKGYVEMTGYGDSSRPAI